MIELRLIGKAGRVGPKHNGAISEVMGNIRSCSSC